MKFGTITIWYTPLKYKLKANVFLIIIGFAMVFFQSSCNTETANTTQNAKNEELPLDFVNFYERFHSDTSYQKEHIVFPLQGIPPIDSQSMDQVSAFTWSSKEWKFHHKADNSKNLYDITYQILGPTVITEQIHLKGSNYKMLRRFSKSRNEQWYLIYYAAMNEYK